MNLGGLFGEPREVTQPLHQVARGDRADMADAEPEQQPRRVGLALRLDRGEQIVHRLVLPPLAAERSEEHTSDLQSLMRTSYAVLCLQNNSYSPVTHNNYTTDTLHNDHHHNTQHRTTPLRK